MKVWQQKHLNFEKSQISLKGFYILMRRYFEMENIAKLQWKDFFRIYTAQDLNVCRHLWLASVVGTAPIGR